jgi:hypothetical protein
VLGQYNSFPAWKACTSGRGVSPIIAEVLDHHYRSLTVSANVCDCALRRYLDVSNGRLEALIRLVQGELSREDRVKIITLITIDVHNRDVVQTLIDKKVGGGDDHDDDDDDDDGDDDDDVDHDDGDDDDGTPP